MTWFKVDDRLASHPKVVKAGLPAMGLWVMAGSWSAHYLTDGHIPAHIVKALGGRTTHVQALVDAGLWIANGDGWQFRDWRDYQPSAEATRAERVASGQRGNHLRWHVKRGRTDPDCELCRNSDR